MDSSENREELLFRVMREDDLWEPKGLSLFQYKRSQVRVGKVLLHLANVWERRGLKAYFIDLSAAQMKQQFYLASKLRIFSAGQDGGEKLETTAIMFYALFSDNLDVIYAATDPNMQEILQSRFNPLVAEFTIHMYQLAIQGDDEQLKSKINKIAANGRKIERTEAASSRDFFSLLIKRDKAALEELIQNKHASIKGNGTLLDCFLAYQAAFETKLCWFRGIPVEIDWPAVPMELMPVDPIVRYDDVYEFLAPGWRPPRQGLSGTISRWLNWGS
jgi:hypothetical protein